MCAEIKNFRGRNFFPFVSFKMLLWLLFVGLSEASFPIPEKSIISVRGTKLRIMEFLDSGSSSKIYSGTRIGHEHSDLPRELAVKYLCPENIDFLHHIDQEMTALAKLAERDVPRVVRAYYASGLLKGSPPCRFIVLSRTGKDFDRYVCGSDDFNSVKLEGVTQRDTGRLSVEAFAASVGLLLIDTLRKIHTAGVAHRDIMPYNIAVGYPLGDVPILLDFGGAQFRDKMSAEEFQSHVRNDERQLRDFVSWIVQQRIAFEFGKLRRDELKTKSELVRAIEGSRGSDELASALTAFLQNEAKLDWTNEPKKIVYTEQL